MGAQHNVAAAVAAVLSILRSRFNCSGDFSVTTSTNVRSREAALQRLFIGQRQEWAAPAGKVRSIEGTSCNQANGGKEPLSTDAAFCMNAGYQY